MGIDIISTLSRKNGANFPIALGEDVIGAFVTVADLTARDAIPTAILRTGAIVRIGTTSNYYEWNGAAWVSIVFGGGGGGTGDVVGPASSIDGRFALFDGTTGKLLELSTYTPASLLAAADTAADAGDAAVAALIPTAGNGITNSAGTWSLDAADSTLVVGAPGIKRAPITGDVTIADGSNAATIANDAVTYDKLQNVSAASRVLGRGSAAGAGNAEELTPTGGVTVSGTNLQLNAVLAPLATAGSAGQQPRMNSGGTAFELFTPASSKKGSNLTDANQTVTRAGGSLYSMLAGVATAARTKTCGTSALNSTTHLGFNFQFEIQVQGFDVLIADPALGTIHTVPAGEKHFVSCTWNGATFDAVWIDLE